MKVGREARRTRKRLVLVGIERREHIMDVGKKNWG